MRSSSRAQRSSLMQTSHERLLDRKTSSPSCRACRRSGSSTRSFCWTTRAACMSNRGGPVKGSEMGRDLHPYTGCFRCDARESGKQSTAKGVEQVPQGAAAGWRQEHSQDTSAEFRYADRRARSAGAWSLAVLIMDRSWGRGREHQYTSAVQGCSTDDQEGHPNCIRPSCV